MVYGWTSSLILCLIEKFIITTQETLHCYIKQVIEEIIENTLLLIKELKFGTIFPNNTKNLDPTVLLNQY
jgi:hypothetical protein